MLPIAGQPARSSALQPPLWRREPYRLLFPLGWALAFWGTGPWLLFATGVDHSYRSVFHAMAQVQGFLTCYAAGFLLTFIPRRTGTAPPPAALVIAAALCPVLTTAFAFANLWAASQAPWAALLLAMAVFAVRRARLADGARGVPPSFVWVPLTLLAALTGVVVTGVAAAIGPEWMWLHDAARGVVLQGTFTGLMLGIGAFLLPVLAYGRPPPDVSGALSGLGRGPHALLALAFFASFGVEAVNLAAGHALRGLVAFIVFFAAGLHHWPTASGTHRKLAWVGAWCIPVGYAAVAAMPQYRQVGLHVVFIGGFALSPLAVSAHVVLSHGGATRAVNEASLRSRLLLLLMLGAIAWRALVVVDPQRWVLWVGAAAACFVAALLAWMARVGRYLVPR